MIIIYNDLNLLHKLSSKHHPQRPQRITAIVQYLKQTKFNQNILEASSKLKKQNQLNLQLNKITEQQILLLHGKRYFDFIQGMWCEGLSKPQMFINQDTYYVKETFNSAFQAAKTCLYALKNFILIQKQNSNQPKNVVCLVRPPGHHSGMKSQPHGFSFFNNVALAANYFTQKTKKKAVIIDWDIHHGQGTQKIFYNRNDVLYISLHRYDQGKFFPHIKQSNHTYLGQKQGQGYNINICWNFPSSQNPVKTQQKVQSNLRSDKQTITDRQYIYCFKTIILPILMQFQPQIVFVSCGFDCAEGDPIGEGRISKFGFKQMTEILSKLGKKVFVVLQGGYNLQTLKWGVQGVLQGLDSHLNHELSKKQSNQNKKDDIQFQSLNLFAQKDIQAAIVGIKKYWKID